MGGVLSPSSVSVSQTFNPSSAEMAV